MSRRVSGVRRRCYTVGIIAGFFTGSVMHGADVVQSVLAALLTAVLAWAYEVYAA